MLGWWRPEIVSTYGGSVFYVIYWTSGVVMMIVQARLSRVRHGTSTPHRPPLEAVWAIVPALIVICLGVLSHHSWNEIAHTRSAIALDETQLGNLCTNGCRSEQHEPPQAQGAEPDRVSLRYAEGSATQSLADGSRFAASSHSCSGSLGEARVTAASFADDGGR